MNSLCPFECSGKESGVYSYSDLQISSIPAEVLSKIAEFVIPKNPNIKKCPYCKATFIEKNTPGITTFTVFGWSNIEKGGIEEWLEKPLVKTKNAR